MIRVLGLALYGPLAASTRYRLMQYAPGLAERGIEIEVESLLGDNYLSSRFSGQRLPVFSLLYSGLSRLVKLFRQRKYNCAIIHCELFKFLPGILENRLLRIPYLYDFDDAFYLKYRGGRFRSVDRLLGGKFDFVMRHAAAVTAGSRVLADYAERLNPETTLLPTVVDTARYRNQPVDRDGIFTVGWIGSPSTFGYLSRITGPLSRLGEEGPTRLLLVGGGPASIPNVEVVNVPWSEDTEILHINSFDVGVMPLPDDDWARGKCAFKLIQCMACGVPVIASPVGANRDVLNEASGILANSSEEWFRAFRYLRDHPQRRREMGSAGRRRVESDYSLGRNLPLMADVIESVCRGRNVCAGVSG